MVRDMVVRLNEIAEELFRSCLTNLNHCDHLMTSDPVQRDALLPSNALVRKFALQTADTIFRSCRRMLNECIQQLRSNRRPSPETLDHVIHSLEYIESDIEKHVGRLIPVEEGNALLDSIRVFLEAVRDANDPQLAGRAVPAPAIFNAVARVRNPPPTPSRRRWHGYQLSYPRVTPLQFPQAPPTTSPTVQSRPQSAYYSRPPTTSGHGIFKIPPGLKRQRCAFDQYARFDDDFQEYWSRRINSEMRREQPFDFTIPPSYEPGENEAIINTPVQNVNPYMFKPWTRPFKLVPMSQSQQFVAEQPVVPPSGNSTQRFSQPAASFEVSLNPFAASQSSPEGACAPRQSAGSEDICGTCNQPTRLCICQQPSRPSDPDDVWSNSPFPRNPRCRTCNKPDNMCTCHGSTEL